MPGATSRVIIVTITIINYINNDIIINININHNHNNHNNNSHSHMM